MVKRRVLDWKPWLYGLAAAGIGGAASGITGGGIVYVIDPRQFNIWTAAFWQLVAALLVLNGGFSMWLYLKQSPLPKIVEIDEPDSPTV
jgi:hypothetical protein